MNDPEFRLAMIWSQHFWTGTSKVEGALAIMAEMRRRHPEQFQMERERRKAET